MLTEQLPDSTSGSVPDFGTDNGIPLYNYAVHDPDRIEIEAFIARSYRECFSARLSCFLPILVSHHPAGSLPRFAFGLAPAAAGPLFLENYLDQPVESLLSENLQTRIERSEIAELGNLAFSGPRDIRQDFISIARHCRDLGFRYVVCTATRVLRLLLRNSGVTPIFLADAKYERVPQNGTHWGNYYRLTPQIVAGDVNSSLIRFNGGK